MADRNAQIIVALKNQASPGVRQIASDYRQLINQLQAGGATLDQAERKMLSLAQAKARTFTAAGQAQQGERELSAALSLVTRESTTAYNAQTQLVSIQDKLAKGSKGATGGVQQLGGGLSGLQGLIGGLGLTFGVQQIIAFGKAAGEQALELRETKNSLRAVAGDAKTYGEVLATARRQQLLFGGSLKDNIEGLSGLTITARSSGASLQTLIDLSQRLAVLDPAQGAQGARIALSEALSGDPTSLARRFEIPKSALKKLRDETIPVEERLRVIDQYLNKVGITSQSVAGKVDQDALAYRRLAQELGDLQTNAGGNLASTFSGAATGLSRLVGLINGNPQAIAELKAILAGRGSVDQAALDDAARQVALARARDSLGGQRGQAIVTDRLGGAQQYAEVVRLLAEISLKGEDAARAGNQLTTAFRAGTLQGDAYAQQLRILAEGSASAMDAEDRRAAALAGITDATRKAAAETSGYAAALRDAAAAQGALALSGPKALFDGSGQGQTNATRTLGQRMGQVFGQGLGEAAGKFASDQARVRQAQLALDLARANTAQQRIAIYQRELAATTDQAERLRILAQIEQERNSGAKAHTSELNKQVTLEERIRDAKVSQYKAQLDASAAIIRDRQQRRQEDQEIRQAQRILSSGRASQAFKDAAADKLALIGIEQQQRLLDINEKLATAGGQIINGRVFQGRPGGGSIGAQIPAGGALPAIAALPGPGGAPAGMPPIEVIVELDGQQIAANVVTRLRGGHSQATSAGTGRG